MPADANVTERYACISAAPAGAANLLPGHQEYWIPAEYLDAFNAAIVGEIKVTASFP